jgi:hypothetical protein
MPKKAKTWLKDLTPLDVERLKTDDAYFHEALRRVLVKLNPVANELRQLVKIRAWPKSYSEEASKAKADETKKLIIRAGADEWQRGIIKAILAHRRNEEKKMTFLADFVMVEHWLGVHAKFPRIPFAEYIVWLRSERGDSVPIERDDFRIFIDKEKQSMNRAKARLKKAGIDLSRLTVDRHGIWPTVTDFL